jgi:hypothetical protein
MRFSIRLLAPLCILATAIYLAYLASSHSGPDSSPITTVANEKANLNLPKKQPAAHLAIQKAQDAKSNPANGTADPNHP